MMVSILLLITFILTFLLCLGSFSFVKIFLTALGIFLAVNIVYILWAFSTCQLVRDTTKPIEKEKPLCRFATSTIFNMVCSYMGLGITVTGREKLPQDAKYLLVCNHRSGFDPVVIMDRLAKEKISCIAKPSIMSLPVIGRVAHGIGCLAIDRDNDRNALKTILAAANYLKKGVCNICIFPEGTRSKSGELLPFHAGSFKIAQRAGAPVVIAAIDGTENIMKNVPLRRTRVSLKILEVVPAEQVKAMQTQELADYSRELIAKTLAEVAE